MKRTLSLLLVLTLLATLLMALVPSNASASMIIILTTYVYKGNGTTVCNYMAFVDEIYIGTYATHGQAYAAAQKYISGNSDTTKLKQNNGFISSAAGGSISSAGIISNPYTK